MVPTKAQSLCILKWHKAIHMNERSSNIFGFITVLRSQVQVPLIPNSLAFPFALRLKLNSKDLQFNDVAITICRKIPREFGFVRLRTLKISNRFQ